MTKNTRNTLLITFGVAAGVALLVAAGYFGISGRAPTEAEKALLVTARDLAPYGITASDSPACETWSAKRNLDFSLEIEYEYDADADPDSDGDVTWFLCQAEINLTPREGRKSFHMTVAAYRTGFFLGGGKITCVEVPGLVAIGEQNYAARLVVGTQTVGNIVVTQKGDTVLSLIFTGVQIDDPDILRELLAPRLARIGAKR